MGLIELMDISYWCMFAMLMIVCPPPGGVLSICITQLSTSNSINPCSSGSIYWCIQWKFYNSLQNVSIDGAFPEEHQWTKFEKKHLFLMEITWFLADKVKNYLSCGHFHQKTGVLLLTPSLTHYVKKNY